MNPQPPAGPARRLYRGARRGYEGLQKALLAEARLLSAPLRALPDFLIVGAQKGGTTSLYDYLAGHPHVVRAFRKEIHFFDNEFGRGLRWYRGHFPLKATLKARRAITGEASPYYLYHPHAARRIASVVPEARLIVCLRNPVDRAVSHYWHVVRARKEKLPMAEAFRQEVERLDGEHQRLEGDDQYRSAAHQVFSYVGRGLYAAQVARYFEHFGREQVLILRSEDLFRDTQTVYDRVLGFLGLEPHPLPPAPPVRNQGTYKSETPEGLREEMTAYYRPHNERLYALLGIESAWW